MRELHEEARLRVDHLVRVGEEQVARHDEGERKDVAPPRARISSSSHPPLRQSEERGEGEQDPVLQHLEAEELRPEADPARLPALRIHVVSHEDRESDEEQWPVLRPRSPARPLEDGEQAHRHDEQSGHVVAELRPCHLLRAARRGRVPEVGGRRQLGEARRLESRPLRREHRADLRERGLIGTHIDRGRGGADRRREEDRHDGQSGFDLEAPSQQDRARPGGPERWRAAPARQRETAVQRAVIQSTEDEQRGEQRDLREHHRAVRSADGGARAGDVLERQRHAAQRERRHRDCGQRGEWPEPGFRGTAVRTERERRRTH